MTVRIDRCLIRMLLHARKMTARQFRQQKLGIIHYVAQLVLRLTITGFMIVSHCTVILILHVVLIGFIRFANYMSPNAQRGKYCNV